MSRNISYRTDELVRYFAQNRIAWEHFYESERVIIEQLNLDGDRAVLDIGCGCGGLGLTLRDRFGVRKYTGIEINPQAAEAGRALNPDARILCADILEVGAGELRGSGFDAVFSLGCVDWNVCFDEMLAAAWSFVAPGGYLVATFRLTDGPGCNDLGRSYQYINYGGIHEGERAAYVVVNAQELLQRLSEFHPSEIRGFGYWGSPSKTAVTPYDRLCFSAFSIRKPSGPREGSRIDLKLPEEIRGLVAAPG
jgi:SAM-dependent methyltransferase